MGFLGLRFGVLLCLVVLIEQPKFTSQFVWYCLAAQNHTTTNKAVPMLGPNQLADS